MNKPALVAMRTPPALEEVQSIPLAMAADFEELLQ
jgi:hypothetical protein